MRKRSWILWLALAMMALAFMSGGCGGGGGDGDSSGNNNGGGPVSASALAGNWEIVNGSGSATIVGVGSAGMSLRDGFAEIRNVVVSGSSVTFELRGRFDWYVDTPVNEEIDDFNGLGELGWDSITAAISGNKISFGSSEGGNSVNFEITLNGNSGMSIKESGSGSMDGYNFTYNVTYTLGKIGGSDGDDDGGPTDADLSALAGYWDGTVGSGTVTTEEGSSAMSLSYGFAEIKNVAVSGGGVAFDIRCRFDWYVEVLDEVIDDFNGTAAEGFERVTATVDGNKISFRFSEGGDTINFVLTLNSASEMSVTETGSGDGISYSVAYTLSKE